jgi:hypothetical protein
VNAAIEYAFARGDRTTTVALGPQEFVIDFEKGVQRGGRGGRPCFRKTVAAESEAYVGGKPSSPHDGTDGEQPYSGSGGGSSNAISGNVGGGEYRSQGSTPCRHGAKCHNFAADHRQAFGHPHLPGRYVNTAFWWALLDCTCILLVSYCYFG